MFFLFRVILFAHRTSSSSPNVFLPRGSVRVRGEPRQAVRPPELPDIRRSAVMRKVPMAGCGYFARVSASTVLAVAGIRTWNGHI
jgi:hypothetical protein